MKIPILFLKLCLRGLQHSECKQNGSNLVFQRNKLRPVLKINTEDIMWEINLRRENERQSALTEISKTQLSKSTCESFKTRNSAMQEMYSEATRPA